jgi:ABC-type phosphate/phosphonate transport system permease subunit
MFVKLAIHLIILTISLLSFDVFYLGYGPEASHTERLIMALLFCAILYGVVASFIEDLRRSGLSRFQIAQTSVSLAVFGFIILLNAGIGYKIANQIALASWENAYVDWLNIVFFLIVIALRVLIPFSHIFSTRPHPKAGSNGA